MCITSIEYRELKGSGKGQIGWFDVTNVAVCNDHPHHFMAEWCINIDVVNPALGPTARIALELDLESARALAAAINKVCDESEELDEELQHSPAKPKD